MPQIIFDIPADKIQRIIDAMVGIYPIPKIEDPEWVDPEDGSTAPMIPEFTPVQWSKEAVRRFVVKTVRRWEQHQAIQAVDVPVDEDLLE
jgi:hypothetical protein